MSTVQRKVFEQLKSFMGRITFNKKKSTFLQDQLGNHRQAGIPGKPPLLLGGAGGDQGEGSLCCPALQGNREGMFEGFTFLKLVCLFDQASGLGLRDGAFCQENPKSQSWVLSLQSLQKSAMFQVSLKPHVSLSLFGKKVMNFWSNADTGQRGSGPSFTYTHPVIYRLVSKPKQEIYCFSQCKELKPGEIPCFLMSLTKNFKMPLIPKLKVKVREMSPHEPDPRMYLHKAL